MKYDIYDYDFEYEESRIDVSKNKIKQSKTRPCLVLEDDIIVPVVKITHSEGDYKIIDYAIAGVDDNSWLQFDQTMLASKKDLVRKRGHLSQRDINNLKQSHFLESLKEATFLDYEPKEYEKVEKFLARKFHKTVKEIRDIFGDRQHMISYYYNVYNGKPLKMRDESFKEDYNITYNFDDDEDYIYSCDERDVLDTIHDMYSNDELEDIVKDYKDPSSDLDDVILDNLELFEDELYDSFMDRAEDEWEDVRSYNRNPGRYYGVQD